MSERGRCRGRRRSAPTTSPGSRARARCSSSSATAASTTSSCGSTSRRASSRRSCAGARSRRRPTSPRASAGSARSPTRSSSVLAMEQACGVEVGGQLRALRRLLYCGEWIESHALHVFMLHAPDFLGYASAVELAKDHRELVERALHLKKTGNEIMRVIGGREVHPINVKVGGFYRAPAKRELAALVDDLERAREFALETVRLHGGLRLPRVRAGLRARLARRARPVPDRPRPPRLEPRARHPRLRVRAAFRRGARRVVERAPLARDRARQLPRRAARPLRAQRRPALAARAGVRRRRRARPRRAQPVPLDRGSLGRARLRRRRGAPPDRRVRGAGRARARGRPACRRRLRLHRGAAGDLLAPLRARRRGDDPRREDRPADLAEPDDDRSRPARRRRAVRRPARRRALAALRAGDPQLRPLHLLRDPLPEARGRSG